MIDPRVGYVRDSFVAMALVLDLLAATGEPLSRLGRDCRDMRWSRTSIPWRRAAATGRADRAAVAGALGPDRGGVPRRECRPARRPAARLGRPLGARPRQQYRADRPGDRRGRRAAVARELADQIGRWVHERAEGQP